MNTKPNDIRYLIDSAEYNHLLEELQKKFKIQILNDVSDLEFENDCNKCQKAELLMGDVKEVLFSDKERLLFFIIEKLSKISPAISWKSEQEFGEGDDLEEEDDEEEEEEVLGYPKNFLVIYLIEFYILKNKPDFLEKYLTLIRVSGAKKYAKDLMKIYQKL